MKVLGGFVNLVEGNKENCLVRLNFEKFKKEKEKSFMEESFGENLSFSKEKIPPTNFTLSEINDVREEESNFCLSRKMEESVMKVIKDN